MTEDADATPGKTPATDAAPTRTVDQAHFPVVGVGASAGGIQALQTFFAAVPPDCGMAFIVVLHMDPAKPSFLDELIARASTLPVTRAEQGMTVEPEHVYVIPHGSVLTLNDGRLSLSPRDHLNTIDECFHSLAADRGENAACVIMTGTGTDGTIGLRAIKEHGGVAVAQSDAEYDGMMRSAVATGLVDFMLPVQDIPDKLVDYFGHLDRVVGERSGIEIGDHLRQITELLRAQTGHDFSGYKDRTIIRRVQRRMHVLQMTDPLAFIDRMKKDAGQVTLLFHDLLIGVTSFFRDPEAYAALEREVIPKLFENKGPEDAVRVWVPGCASGEEAYSLAILLREHAPKTKRGLRLQIFASDIDEQAIEAARAGRYPAAIGSDIAPERLDRYFVREDGTYRIANDLREICLFSVHNLLQDAPFSKLDLISCRNLMIYLGNDLQDRIIPLFHYALNDNGYLFLGTSENVTRHARLFTVLDRGHRIFQRRTQMDRWVPQFPLTTPDPTRRAAIRHPYRAPMVEPTLKAAADRQVLENFAPAYVVVTAEGDLVQSSARTGRYLELPAGAPDTNLFNMARPGLRLELRAGLHKATGGQTAVQRNVVVGVNGGRQEIDLIVQPLRFGSGTDPLYLVVFQDLGGLKPATDPDLARAEDDVANANVRQLEAELRLTRERLQTATEELESSNEELKSSNEELQSINEELQSTNEELETSKEELQSINEELQTVNAELNARVDELSRANNDMHNLLESTQIATVFLDRSLSVKSFTPAAKDIFRLVESDTGRPIMHVLPRVELQNLQEDAERVLRTLGTIEHPVNSLEKGARYMMRLLPYRTADNVISGVVMTFTDITRIAEAEARIEQLAHDLRARINELETLLDLVPVGVMIVESGPAAQVLINPYGARLLGAPDGHKGLMPAPMPFRLFEGDREVAREDQPLQRAARTGEAVANWQGRLDDSGARTDVMISATPLFAENGRVRGAIAAIVDISRHMESERHQQFLLHELQHRVKNILATISSLAMRMARRHLSIETFESAFLARLTAMGRMHDLLASGAWSGASLQSLVEASIGPHSVVGQRDVRINGNEVRLAANTAATIGMVLHELATNAAKYGSLSTANGSVDIGWRVIETAGAGEPRLHFTWTERGGPAPDPNHVKGFGTGFIIRSVEYELGGTATLDFAPEGLSCVIEFPLNRNLEHPPRE
ncbi:MAG: CheR family methyltransferase [Acetobacteraceae bacterium]